MIIITGASKGIGKYLYKRFTEIDEFVYGTYNSTGSDDEAHRKMSKVDVTDYSEVEEWINKINRQMDSVVLINCAGTNYNSFAHKAAIEEWERVIKVNLVGTFNVIRALLPMMREKGYGRIINFASIVAQKGMHGTSAYAASKAGLWGLTKSIAVENARKGITINNLNLGYFDIGMIKEVPENYQNSIKELIPSGAFGTPENIFSAVNFIIETDYINGTSIDINGGLF
jgi:NAD(P)-dependent dehydrogenase (short-subunit alcohol dehydrogenase family)